MIRRRDSGVTLLELMIAMGILVLALIALMSSLISSARLTDGAREHVIAYEAARAKIEEIRNYSNCKYYNNIFTYYSLTANKTAIVEGLNAGKIGGVTQPVLEVVFPVSTTGHLKEDLAGLPNPGTLYDNSVRLGMPKNLNRDELTNTTGSGTAEATILGWVGTTPTGTTDLDVTYKILPVMVRVRWQGIGGRMAQIEVVSYISEK